VFGGTWLFVLVFFDGDKYFCEERKNLFGINFLTLLNEHLFEEVVDAS
jgi:hypothetical protein